MLNEAHHAESDYRNTSEFERDQYEDQLRAEQLGYLRDESDDEDEEDEEGQAKKAKGQKKATKAAKGKGKAKAVEKKKGKGKRASKAKKADDSEYEGESSGSEEDSDLAEFNGEDSDDDLVAMAASDHDIRLLFAGEVRAPSLVFAALLTYFRSRALRWCSGALSVARRSWRARTRTRARRLSQASGPPRAAPL